MTHDKNGDIYFFCIFGHDFALYEYPSWVTVPISRLQTVYITLIITTQVDNYMGWPPLIALHYE
jgi:hypothetical protein